MARPPFASADVAGMFDLLDVVGAEPDAAARLRTLLAGVASLSRADHAELSAWSANDGVWTRVSLAVHDPLGLRAPHVIVPLAERQVFAVGEAFGPGGFV